MTPDLVEWTSILNTERDICLVASGDDYSGDSCWGDSSLEGGCAESSDGAEGETRRFPSKKHLHHQSNPNEISATDFVPSSSNNNNRKPDLCKLCLEHIIDKSDPGLLTFPFPASKNCRCC